MNVLFPHLTVRDLSLITILTALNIGGNYALIALPNIKIMDLVVFITGFAFGASIGAITGALTWIVYGAINPYGFSPPVWLSTIVCEALFGIVGGILGRTDYRTSEKGFSVFWFSVEIGLCGLILTIVYDLLTNIVFAVIFGLPIVAVIVTGWLIPPWFGILHEASNLILFSSSVYPLTRVIRTFRGGEKA